MFPDLKSFCQKLWNQKKITWDHLKKSKWSQEFDNIRDRLNINNARQVIWHGLNQVYNIPTCVCGNQLNWHPDKFEYRKFCSKKCTATHTVSARKLTSLTKYGVEIASQGKDFKEKVAKTSMAKFGTDHYTKTQEYQDRVIKTNRKKYGVDRPSQNKDIRQKMRNTCIDRYGVDHPWKNEKIKSQIEAKLLERYNTIYPTQSKIVQERIMKTNEQKYGVKHVQQVPLIKSKGSLSKRINQHGQDVVDILDDPDILHQQNVDGKPIMQLARELNVSRTTVANALIKHGHTIISHADSEWEAEILYYYKQKGYTVFCGNRKILKPKEIDIWFPDQQVAVELDGAYSHNEFSGKDQNYHLNKTLACADKNIFLLHFFDWEYAISQDKVLSKINAALGHYENRIGARSLEIKILDRKTSDTFFENNHMQNSCIHKICIGLINSNNEIISAMSFSKSRYDKTRTWELLRFCNKLNWQVVGAASRLLTYFVRNYAGSGDTIISYANRRWSQGNLYKQLGFTFLTATDPGYYYLNSKFQIVGSRQNWQKHMLIDKLEKFNPMMTEVENMHANGYSRIWDCGNLVYEYQI